MIRCAKCNLFTKNNIALRGWDSIKDARGDCARCGPGIRVEFDAWEDWGWSEEDDLEFEARLMDSTFGWRTLPHEATTGWFGASDTAQS